MFSFKVNQKKDVVTTHYPNHYWSHNTSPGDRRPALEDQGIGFKTVRRFRST